MGGGKGKSNLTNYQCNTKCQAKKYQEKSYAEKKRTLEIQGTFNDDSIFFSKEPARKVK